MFKMSLIKARKTEQDPLVMATPTNNLVRLNQASAELLGISYAEVLSEEGSYITAGKVEVDGEMRLAFVTVPASVDIQKAKLASPTNTNSGSLHFASGGVHSELNGDNQNNIVWRFTDKVDIDDEGNATVIDDETEAAGTTGWLVEYVETRPAGNNKAADKDDAEPKGKGKGKAAAAMVAADDDDDFMK